MYNSILRKWPVDKYEAFKDNSFTTALSVLVSAVLTLSRAVNLKIPAGTPLYIGLGVDTWTCQTASSKQMRRVRLDSWTGAL
jgi:hypothetical protein